MKTGSNVPFSRGKENYYFCKSSPKYGSLEDEAFVIYLVMKYRLTMYHHVLKNVRPEPLLFPTG